MAHRKRYYYLICMQYLGFRYHGWQKQPNGKTVQEMVDKTLHFILGHSDYKTLAASRTDAMVSAAEAYIELFCWEPLDETQLYADLNINLPNDIRVLSVKETDAKFNIIQDVSEKEYQYFFSYGTKNHPFCAPLLVCIREKLDIELMQKAAAMFKGRHNYRPYCYKPKEGTDFVREVSFSALEENKIYTANFFPEETFVFRVRSKGFMRNQVRLMMGALIEVGRGSMSMETFKDTLNGNYPESLTYIAPASGLILADTNMKDLNP